VTFINDKTYRDISTLAYDTTPSTEDLNNIPGWVPVEPEGAMLHDTNGSGFDATVFYNEKTNQVIIGYRGTEPPGNPLRSILMDYGTDIFDVAGGNRFRNLEKGHEYYEENKDAINQLPLQTAYAVMQTDSRYHNNQFAQAQDLYDVVKKQYPTAEISTTGHSLGGAEAEFVAVRNGLHSVSFNAPNITHLLTDDLQEKVKNGKFHDTNIAYVHPGDAIGSGAVNSQPHVGATYYINSTFDDANNRYNTIYIPYTIPQRRDNWFAQLVFGDKWTPIKFVPYTYPLGKQSAVMKMYNSVSGEEYHSLKHFEFDENGNLVNSLYTMDGESVEFNPRVSAYERMIAASKWTGSDMVTFIGNMNGGSIQLTPEELQRTAQQMRSSLQEFDSGINLAIRLFQAQVETSQSNALKPIVYDATDSFRKINQWYLESISDIANYIDLKAKLFIAADQQH